MYGSSLLRYIGDFSTYQDYVCLSSAGQKKIKSLPFENLSIFQIKLSFIHYNTRIAHMLHKAIAHPRYFLGGHRPSETSILTSLDRIRIISPNLKILIATVLRLLLP